MRDVYVVLTATQLSEVIHLAVCLRARLLGIPAAPEFARLCLLWGRSCGRRGAGLPCAGPFFALLLGCGDLLSGRPGRLLRLTCFRKYTTLCYTALRDKPASAVADTPRSTQKLQLQAGSLLHRGKLASELDRECCKQ